MDVYKTSDNIPDAFTWGVSLGSRLRHDNRRRMSLTMTPARRRITWPTTIPPCHLNFRGKELLLVVGCLSFISAGTPMLC